MQRKQSKMQIQKSSSFVFAHEIKSMKTLQSFISFRVLYILSYYDRACTSSKQALLNEKTCISTAYLYELNICR